jgi:hypothetical protein
MATEVTYSRVDEAFSDRLESLFGMKDGGLIEINPGRILMPPRFKEVAQRIVNMEVRPDDIWLISYPRTGKLKTATFACKLNCWGS